MSANRLSIVLVAAAAAVLQPTFASANLLLTNPGFETVSAGNTGYSSVGPAANPTYFNGWTGSSNGAGAATGQGSLAGQQGFAFGYVNNANLETAAASRAIVTAGTSYSLSFILRDATPAESTTISLIFYDGNAVGSLALGSVSQNYAFPAAAVRSFTGPYTISLVAPAGATFAAARFSNSDGGGTIGADAFDLNAVPEPASLGLLGLGGVAVLARRRKTI